MRTWLLGFCGLLVAGCAQAETGDGWAAWQAHRYADAVSLWTPAAKAGDVSAAFGLGIAYDLGQGVAANSVTACAWYGRAGAAGHTAAAFNTGILYDSGRCGPRRADLAALWYSRAAAAGHPRGAFNIAQLYAAGDGVPRNAEIAAVWFKIAAARGLPAAAGRDQPGVRPTTGKASVTPVALQDALREPDGSAVLVWTAPPQPSAVRFLVEVAALRPGGVQEIVARYVDETALRLAIPDAEAQYAWRVLTVGAEAQRYALAPWQRMPGRP